MPKMWKADDGGESDRKDRLEALRDRLTEAVERAADKDLAPLARQLQSVLAELDKLPVAREGEVVDDLASRRADRRSKAAGS